MRILELQWSFAIDSLQVTLRNAPLAPSDPAHAQRFEADAIVRLEVPVRFGGRILPSMWITLKVQAGYTEVVLGNDLDFGGLYSMLCITKQDKGGAEL